MTEDQISEALELYNDKGDQLEITQFIKRKNLSLMKEDNSSRPSVLLEKLLEDTINGNRIVEKILDDCVRDTAENENSRAYSIKLDWSKLLDKDKNQTCFLFYLLRLRTRYARGDFCPYSDLLKHPVVEIFTKLKWERSLKYFTVQAIIFFSFLILYSTFLGILLNRPTIASTTPTRSTPNSTNNSCTTFLQSNCGGIFVCELLLLMVTIILTVSEIFQAFKMRRQFLKEMENRFYFTGLVSAFLCMGLKSSLLEAEGSGPLLRGLAAIGILFSWLELIFVMGRFPYFGIGGCLSVMFFNVIRKLSTYMIAMIIMITGHAMAFLVVGYGHGNEENKNDMISFDDPFKAIVQTLTMALGEFNLDNLYSSLSGDRTSRIFALILLALLITLGTITLVNLFIAVTMSDMERLKRDVHTQKLVNMASFVILLEDSLPRWLSDIRLEETTVLCAQDICTRECRAGGKYHLKNGHSLMEKLKKIARENREREVRTLREV